MLSLGGPGGRLREVEFAADAPVVLRNSYKMLLTRDSRHTITNYDLT